MVKPISREMAMSLPGRLDIWFRNPPLLENLQEEGIDVLILDEDIDELSPEIITPLFTTSWVALEPRKGSFCSRSHKGQTNSGRGPDIAQGKLLEMYYHIGETEQAPVPLYAN